MTEDLWIYLLGTFPIIGEVKGKIVDVRNPENVRNIFDTVD